MYVLLYLLLCATVAYMGRNRKLGFWGYLFASMLFTPLIGVVLLLASDKKAVAAN
ncbi:hypothetical protein [Pseudidiomarina aestuarii]|uniref:hypothetical protein n=1 Tax=Pseudidiomarina aestuarii TaxID=624146 RepID=UPI003A976E9B